MIHPVADLHAGQRTTDAAFAKYTAGAYHWTAIGRHPLWHHAFTAERYRRTLALLGRLRGLKVLDYGCGDGALLSLVRRQVGPAGAAHGFDPNPTCLALAEATFKSRGLRASFWSAPADLPKGYFDRAVCAEVIEHVHDVPALLSDLEAVMVPCGLAVVTTPVRLTETPEDPNHVQEWFPDEFVRLLDSGPLELVSHETAIPAAAAEVYYWRPWLTLRLPLFRILCNALSIAGVNALSFLRVRPRLHMQQFAVLRKRASG